MRVETPSQIKVYPQLTKDFFREAEAADITRVQAQILHNRGLQTIAEMQKFINARYEETPDPHTLIDLSRAVMRIQQALEQREHITVYGDYDADGVTSSALLFRALRVLKDPAAPLDYHIPNRQHDGCGLNLHALNQLKARGTQLIITTDCASSDVEQVEYARTLGIDVIITDHHHPPAQLPAAYAMVNPWRPDCTYGERYLCGVGVAFKLVQALYRAYTRSTEEEMELLDLVAVGTVADIAPLLGENHTLVKLGMQRLNTTRKPGLQALIRSANLKPGKIRERDIAYGLAPRINAAGRMKEASIAFELLTTDDADEANARVAELDQLNQARQQETEELMRSVRSQAEHQPTKAVVLVSGDAWHEGIIGLVAGKLSDEINKPVLVLSNDNETHLSRGSARSQKGFNIIEALRGFATRLERYGGHAQAAGFTIRSERIEELHTHLLNWQANGGAPALIEGTELPDPTGVVTEQESAPPPAPQMVDLVFTRLELLNYNLYKSLRELSPFGAGNPDPLFKMEGLRLLNTWSSGTNGQNLRMKLGSSSGHRVGTFLRAAHRRNELAGVERVNVLFRVESSEDESRPDIWLKILEFEVAGATKE
jgi:single-stranded-DNA-specific exonuclease